MPVEQAPPPSSISALVSAPRAWIVRAGRKGVALDFFLEKGRLAVGWGKNVGDLTGAPTKAAIKAQVASAYPDASPGKLGAVTGCLQKIRKVIQAGDAVVTYDPSSRQYHAGVVSSDYRYERDEEFGHWREVNWLAQIDRDALSDSTKYRLGSLLTVFEVESSAWAEIRAKLSGATGAASSAQDETEDESADEAEIVDPVEEALEQAHEYRKDEIAALGPDEMEAFVACILRGMGYRARVSPKGPDRGRDVEASPDGLGLEEPRIRVEVKHREAKMGSQEVRAFLGALRPGDKGLYVSTGGFTREAMYEAERSQVPASLVDLDRLAELYVEFYEELSPEDRRLVPLRRVYWPGGVS